MLDVCSVGCGRSEVVGVGGHITRVRLQEDRERMTSPLLLGEALSGLGFRVRRKQPPEQEAPAPCFCLSELLVRAN